MSRVDDLTAWRYFLVFAQSGSLANAAKILDVESSNISRAIRALEKNLGVALVRHNVRPLQVTEEGAFVVKRMTKILGQYERMLDRVKKGNRRLTGRIRLNVPPGFAVHHLTPLLTPFLAEYPDVMVDIMTGKTEEDVHKGICDVTTVTGVPTLSGLYYKSRGRNVYLAVASARYVKEHGMPLHPSELRDHVGYVYVGPVRKETKVLQRGSQSYPVRFARAIHSTDIISIRDAVLHGNGVAVDLPLLQIVDYLLSGDLVPILPGWSRPATECFIVTNRSAWHSKRIRVFFEWYAATLQAYFDSIEEKVASIVGLPAQSQRFDRQTLYQTQTKK